MKKYITLLGIFMLLTILPKSIRADEQSIKYYHFASTLAHFANASITSPAINVVQIGSGELEVGETLAIRTRESLENYSSFVFNNPNNQWVYYKHTIVYEDDNDPTTLDRINLYNTTITYDNLVAHNPNRTIIEVKVYYSYASKVTINYIDDATQDILDTIIYYGRRAHYNVSDNGISSYDGDLIDYTLNTYPGYTYNRTVSSSNHTRMAEYAYTIDVYYQPVQQYQITYTDGTGDESIFTDEVLTANENDPTPAFTGSTIRPGYTFTGWSPTVAPTVSEAAVYTATWTRNTHQVTYTDGTGTGSIFANQVTTVDEGDPTPAFTGSTTRAGYTFTGWSPTVAPTVSEAAVYTATWTRNTHQVTYTDGTGDESIFTDEVLTANENDPTPAFTGSTTRPGYTFTGWSPTVAPTVSEAAVYTATWTRNTHQITYTDGTGDESIFTDEVLTANENDPTPAFTGSTTRPGYTFTGWSPTVAPTVSEAAVYTATWTRNTHQITYTDGTGDESIFTDVVLTANEGDPTPAFTGSTTRPGYTFTGWSPTVAPTVSEGVVYTANWQAIQTGGEISPVDQIEQPKLPNAGMQSMSAYAYALVSLGLIIIKRRKAQL